MTLAEIKAAIEKAGLSYRGAFQPDPGDLPEGVNATSIVLLGYLGGEKWDHFASSAEAQDGEINALDRWSSRIISSLADELDAVALFPFGGPPWLPFQRWAQKAERLFSSPLGMQIHPEYGLWHSWRGALGFSFIVNPEPFIDAEHPCETCADKPCLSACPVGAFTDDGFRIDACVDHIATDKGVACLDGGCLARCACPVGKEHRYSPAQRQFHLGAFRNAQLQSRK